MIKFPHPGITHTEDGAKLLALAEEWTKSVPDDTPLNAVAAGNFAAIVDGIAARQQEVGQLNGVKDVKSIKSPGVRGRFLEMVVYDVVARVLADESVGLDLIETHVDMKPGKHAEADLLINQKVAILIKVSYRERWKQMDRDAMIMKNFAGHNNDELRVWSLFNAEQDEHTAAQARRKGELVLSQCFAMLSGVASIKDPDGVNRIIEDIRWAVRCEDGESV